MKKTIVLILMSLFVCVFAIGCGSESSGSTTSNSKIETSVQVSKMEQKEEVSQSASKSEEHVHTWKEATCTEPKTCTACGATEGEKLEHDLDSTGKCKLCYNQVGIPLTMENYLSYITVYNPVIDYTNHESIGVDLRCAASKPKDVEYHKVELTFQYTDRQYTVNMQVKLDGDKLDRTSHHDRHKDSTAKKGCVKDFKLVGISGYVIEK